MDFKKMSLESLCVQGGYEAKNGEPRVTLRGFLHFP